MEFLIKLESIDEVRRAVDGHLVFRSVIRSTRSEDSCHRFEDKLIKIFRKYVSLFLNWCTMHDKKHESSNVDDGWFKLIFLLFAMSYDEIRVGFLQSFCTIIGAKFFKYWLVAKVLFDFWSHVKSFHFFNIDRDKSYLLTIFIILVFPQNKFGLFAKYAKRLLISFKIDFIIFRFISDYSIWYAYMIIQYNWLNFRILLINDKRI